MLSTDPSARQPAPLPSFDKLRSGEGRSYQSGPGPPRVAEHSALGGRAHNLVKSIMPGQPFELLGDLQELFAHRSAHCVIAEGTACPHHVLLLLPTSHPRPLSPPLTTR